MSELDGRDASPTGEGGGVEGPSSAWGGGTNQSYRSQSVTCIIPIAP